MPGFCPGSGAPTLAISLHVCSSGMMAPNSWARREPQMPVPRQTLVGRWGQEVWLPHSSAFRTDRRRASQVCTAIIVSMMVSRCCGLTGLGRGQGANPPSPTLHPCQSCTTELNHPSSSRPIPSSVQVTQLIGQGVQAPFLALTLNFLCGLRRLLASSETHFLGYRMAI